MGIIKGTVLGDRSSGGDITISTPIAADQTVLIAVCTCQDGNTANLWASVSRNSQSFTRIADSSNGLQPGVSAYVEVLYLLNPTVGTFDTIGDFSGSINECTITLYPLSGADLAALVNGTPDFDQDNAWAPELDIITDTAACLLIGGMASESVLTGGSGTIDKSYTDQSFENSESASQVGGAAGNQAFSFYMNNSATYAQCVVAIKPAATANSHVGSLLSMFR
jgi:hypothetical protein